MKKSSLIIYAAVIVAVGAVLYFSNEPATRQSGIDVNVPELNTAQIQGQKLFDGKCASCHGKNAGGTDKGPTFMHKVYEPSHHGDGAFFLAAQRGVRAHHWPFGDMPPVDGVTKQEVAQIVHYVRALQRANGLH